VLGQIKEKVDIVFLDPPYGKNLWEDVMASLSDLKLMNDDGLVVLEHPKEIELPQEIYGFRKIKEARYGTVVLSIYMC
jgi:16S rRNA G966 N2-methylase RsmD